MTQRFFESWDQGKVRWCRNALLTKGMQTRWYTYSVCISCPHTLPHTAAHCNTLQHTATHCNTLQYTGVESCADWGNLRMVPPQTRWHNSCAYNTLQHTAPVNKKTVIMIHTLRLRLMSQHTATHCNTLQHTATHCNTPQHTATYHNTLHHAATHCNTLHHTAAYCSTLQHIATFKIDDDTNPTNLIIHILCIQEYTSYAFKNTNPMHVHLIFSSPNHNFVYV